MLYIPNNTSVPWKADSSEKQFSPRQPLRACAESMPGLSKAQLYSGYKNNRTSAPSASPACIKFCHFATLSAPWFGLGALEKTMDNWSSWVPTPGVGLAAKGWWILETFMPYWRKKPWGPQAPLVSAPGRLTRCMGPIRHAAKGIASQTSPALEITENKTQAQLEREWEGSTSACIALRGPVVFELKY